MMDCWTVPGLVLFGILAVQGLPEIILGSADPDLIPDELDHPVGIPILRSDPNLDICATYTNMACGEKKRLKNIAKSKGFVITSPNYPDPPNTASCSWEFVVPAGSNIFIEIPFFAISDTRKDNQCSANDVIVIEMFRTRNKQLTFRSNVCENSRWSKRGIHFKAENYKRTFTMTYKHQSQDNKGFKMIFHNNAQDGPRNLALDQIQDNFIDIDNTISVPDQGSMDLSPFLNPLIDLDLRNSESNCRTLIEMSPDTTINLKGKTETDSISITSPKKRGFIDQWSWNFKIPANTILKVDTPRFIVSDKEDSNCDENDRVTLQVYKESDFKTKWWDWSFCNTDKWNGKGIFFRNFVPETDWSMTMTYRTLSSSNEGFQMMFYLVHEGDGSSEESSTTGSTGSTASTASTDPTTSTTIDPNAVTPFEPDDWVDDGCNCGIDKKTNDKRIIGGQISEKHSIPWQVSVLRKTKVENSGVDLGGGLGGILGGLLGIGSQEKFEYKHVCGGSIVGARTILTAAHCVDGKENDPTNFVVRVAEHDFNDDEEAMEIPVVHIFKHEQWDKNSFNNDFALLILPVPDLDKFPQYTLVFSDRINPVCLESHEDVPFVGREAIASGWGVTKHGSGQTSNILRQVTLKGIDSEECEDDLVKKMNEVNLPIKTDPENFVTDQMICAGHPEEGEAGKDACQGDSGGPLTIQRDGRVRQIGVTSWGVGCALEVPGVYAKVSTVFDWIKEKMEEHDPYIKNCQLRD